MKIDPYKHKERYLNWKEEIKGEIEKLKKKSRLQKRDLFYQVEKYIFPG